MLWSIIFLMSVGAGVPVTEVVSTPRGTLVAAANAASEERDSRLLVIGAEGSTSPVEKFLIMSGIAVKRCGPITWGVVDGAYYSVAHTEAFGLTFSCYSAPIIDHLEMSRNVRPENREAHYAARARIEAYAREHSRNLEVLFKVMEDLRWSGLRREEYNLFFDLAYTAPNHVTLIAVRNGRLRWWTWNKPEETDWVDHGEMETRLEGAFRIVQAGDDLYLVDSRGWVFSSPGRGARLLGTIAGWGTPREGETLFLLEEQKEGKIAVVKVAEGKTTVLEALVEAEAREDFMTTIDDEDLDRAIIRMAAALREEERGGK